MAYGLALKKITELVQAFEENEGANYKHLWKESFQTLPEEWRNDVVEKNTACVSKASSSTSIVILNESTDGLSTLSPYVLYRAMEEKDIWQGTSRILHHVHEPSYGKYHQYSYEMIGHGWVGKLVQRHMVPKVVDKDALIVKELNHHHQESSCWETGGPGDSMLAICATATDVAVPPDETGIRLEDIEARLAKQNTA